MERKLKTINVLVGTWEELQRRKIHPNQSIDEVIRGLLGLPHQEKEGEDAPAGTETNSQ